MSKFINIIIDVAAWVTSLPGSVWNFGYITAESLCVYMFGLFWVMLWNTRFRLYGLIIIAISLYMMFMSPKPDVMFDAKMQILGIKNANGELEITAPKISNFTRTYWNNWYGQKDGILHLEEIDHDQHITTASGKMVDILYDSKYSDAYISVIAHDWLDKGAVLVFCNADKCDIKYEDKKRFRFK